MSIELQDPSLLSDSQRYKQLRQLFQGNRLKNSNWFAHPTEMPLQLHLVSRATGGNSFECHVYTQKTQSWQNYPSQPIASLSSKVKLQELIDKILEDTQGNRADGLGVIFHTDSDLATTEIPLDNGLPNDLRQLAQTLIYEPTATLEDESLAASEYVWRMIPYLNTDSPPYATALVLSRQYDVIAENLITIGQELDIPIRTTILSSPLTVIQALPSLVNPAEGRATGFLIPFDSLTLFGVLDQEGELRILRALQGRMNPSLIVHSIRTTMLSLELGEFDITTIFTEKPNQMLQRALGKNFPQATISSVNGPDLVPEELRGQIPFVIAAANRCLPVQATRLNETKTFALLNQPEWGLANFCDPSAKRAGFEPTKEEIKLAQLGARIRPLLFILPVVVLLFVGIWSYITVKSDVWNFKSSSSSSAEIKKLKAANLQHQKLGQLLLDRSRAWSNMELLSRAIPRGKGIYVDKFNYSASPTRVEGGGIGLTRTWRISGYYNDKEAGNSLLQLGTVETITKLFKEVYDATGDESFNLEVSTRKIGQPRLSESQNQRANDNFVDERGIVNPALLPRVFQLDIQQTFQPKDPLSLPNS